MQIKFPAIWFPAFKLSRGQLLDVSLLGVGLVIPPWDVSFWDAVQLTAEFVIFDTDAIGQALAGAFAAIPNAVWNYLHTYIQAQIDEYYKAHPERKQK